ncbi:MAG: hypothetical protein EPO41_03905 [Reyranella sp.]|uniref:hypothetical protein n=1 Tax=Reyranella sp. TaxID=1929291 RepID=UPI0012160D75|nr:hypothetical protein [Reyranella sp.]TAJ97146.1 MAG: hypothetical protein EPO41_03905 [Reyranella sp.]
MSNLKDKLDKKLEQKAAEIAEATAKPAVKENDPELAAALERVEKGELSRAYRTPNGALVITHKSDPDNSPAAPEAPTGR